MCVWFSFLFLFFNDLCGKKEREKQSDAAKGQHCCESSRTSWKIITHGSVQDNYISHLTKSESEISNLKSGGFQAWAVGLLTTDQMLCVFNQEE